MRIQQLQLQQHGGDPLEDGFARLVESSVKAPRSNELLIEVEHASLDPFQRVWMRGRDPGAVPPADVLGRVVESACPDVAPGELVTARGSLSTHVLVNADHVRKIAPAPEVPTFHELGLFGLSGLTGFLGMTHIGRPQAHQRIVVSGAFGGVGQVASQAARQMGANVLGIVGSGDKVASLSALGIPAVSYRDPGWTARLTEWAPEGVHLYFDNVWGPVSARVVEQLSPGGRVVVCGQISQYDGARIPPLPLDDWFVILSRSLTIQGFRTHDLRQHFPRARQTMRALYAAGRLRQDVEVVQGWEAVPGAFRRMLRGEVKGKLILQAAA